jgi:hypothetical protein
MPDQNFTLGQHEALIQRLVDGQDRIIERLTSIETSLAEKRGERRMAVGFFGIASGAFGAALVSVVKAFLGKHGA